jgi:polyisoprenoid-binding protein YceI
MKRYSSIVTVIFALAATLALARPLRAEQVFRFEDVPDQSKVTVDGTSTVHDWTVRGKIIDGSVELRADVQQDATAQAIKDALLADPKVDVAVEIPVAALKSGKADMDKKMYEALKRDKNPIIRYKLTEAIVEKGNGSDSVFQLQTTGELTVAGETRALRMPFTLEVLDENQLKFTGRVVMKMTDFKMKPPQAALGLIKSGDKVEVRVEWITTRVAATAEPADRTAGK